MPQWLRLLYYANSLAWIGGCLFGVGVGCVAFFSWDPCAVLGGFIIIPLPLLLGWLLYRATFHHNIRSARRLRLAYFFFAVGAVVIIWINAVEAIFAGERVVLVAKIAATFHLAAVYFLLCGWLSGRWAKALSAVPASPEMIPLDASPGRARRFQFTLRDMLAVTCAVAAVLGTAIWLRSKELPRYAEHVTPDQAPYSLPATATDVCYAQGFRGAGAYEFTIDEATFLAWVERQMHDRDTLEPIRISLTMNRFCRFVAAHPGPQEVTIASGWVCAREWKPGRFVRWAYDANNRRAYYECHGP